MSTICSTRISSLYPASQVHAEINWLDREIEKVKEQMKRKPSKIRHLNDLLRQKNQKLEILARG